MSDLGIKYRELIGRGAPLPTRIFNKVVEDEETAMKCAICKTSNTAPGTATVTLQRGDSVVVIKEVPAEVCGQCGEYYLDDSTTAKVLAMAEAGVAHHAEVEILRFAA
jgi:YgiT-type zinc finger domain-containing protein